MSVIVAFGIPLDWLATVPVVIVVAAVWCVVSIAVAGVVARMIRNRDRQVPGPDVEEVVRAGVPESDRTTFEEQR